MSIAGSAASASLTDGVRVAEVVAGAEHVADSQVVAYVRGARGADVDVASWLVGGEEGLPTGDAEVAAVDVAHRLQRGHRSRHVGSVHDHVDVEDRLGGEAGHRGGADVLDDRRADPGQRVPQDRGHGLELLGPLRRPVDDPNFAHSSAPPVSTGGRSAGRGPV